MPLYAGFDCGIVNLAGVVVAFDEDHESLAILDTFRVNITQIPHHRVSREKCTLHHSREAWDWMEHFWQEYGPRLNQWGPFAKVFIEQQPITGLQQISTLLLGRYRKSAVMVSPRSMHKHFHISHLDYEGRKAKTISIAKPYLEDHKEFVEQDQQDHQADALCILFYGIHCQKQAEKKRQLQEDQTKRLKESRACFDGHSLESFFEQFRNT